MGIFLIYCLFAITTSLTSLYEHVYPVLTKANAEHRVPHELWLYYVTFLFIGLLMAPATFLCCIIPSWGIEFREHLDTALFEEAKI